MFQEYFEDLDGDELKEHAKRRGVSAAKKGLVERLVEYEVNAEADKKSSASSSSLHVSFPKHFEPPEKKSSGKLGKVMKSAILRRQPTPAVFALPKGKKKDLEDESSDEGVGSEEGISSSSSEQAASSHEESSKKERQAASGGIPSFLYVLIIIVIILALLIPIVSLKANISWEQVQAMFGAGSEAVKETVKNGTTKTTEVLTTTVGAKGRAK